MYREVPCALPQPLPGLVYYTIKTETDIDRISPVIHGLICDNSN